MGNSSENKMLYAVCCELGARKLDASLALGCFSKDLDRRGLLLGASNKDQTRKKYLKSLT